MANAARTFLGFPFNEELFLYRWNTERDPVLNAFLESGAAVADAEIERLISNGSAIYDLPYYVNATEEELNYDGQTDIVSHPMTADSLRGIVYGRAKAWVASDFVRDFNSGADPMGQILNRVNKHRRDWRQRRLISIVNALFNSTIPAGFEDFENHTHDISSSSATVADSNRVSVTTANDAATKALGDHAQDFNIAIMHSTIANRLQNIQALEYWKYTDSMGVQRNMTIANWGGLTAIIDDGVTVVPGVPGTSATKYHTYIFGTGSIGFATAPVEVPVEIARDPHKNGGQEELITRFRETFMPYGFSFLTDEATVSNKISPTDADLANPANYKLKWLPKNIRMARIISNG